MTTDLIKVAGYIRVSTAIQASEGESLSTQEQQIKDYIKQRGWQLTKLYKDEGLSGTKIEYRTQFQQMVSDAKDGQFSVIVFTKLSRFARNAREYQNLSYELKQNKVDLVSIKENIDATTKSGKMIAGILSLFAEWEHETIKEQMYENKMIRWKSNRSFIGKTPFGYTWNKTTKKLEIVPEEEKMYKKIVSMYLEQGMAFHAIATKLNSEGQPFERINLLDGKVHKKGKWSSATISYMLKNPCYYGHYVVNQRVYKDGPKGAGTLRSKSEFKPVSEAITFEPEKMISKTDWDKIQETTKFKKVQTKRSTEETRSYFLRDVLVCGHCGAAVKPRMGARRKDGTILRYYCCFYAGTSEKKLLEAQKNRCYLPYIKAEEIEKIVWRAVLDKFGFGVELNKFGTAKHGKGIKNVYASIFDTDRFDERIKELELSIPNLDSELKKKMRYGENLMKFEDIDDPDKEEINRLRRINKDEVLIAKSNFDNATLKLSELCRMRDQEKANYDFLNKNKYEFVEMKKKLSKELKDLSIEDQKILVEQMLSEKIVVNYQHDTDGEGEGVQTIIKMRFNPAVFQRFMEEGKLTQLNKNGSYYFAAIYLARST
jgi:site-specific DNA recombinase